MRWESQSSLHAWETCTHNKKQQVELNMEQRTGSKLGKGYAKAAYCHPADLTYKAEYIMPNARLVNHKLESTLLGGISTTSDMQMIPL